MLKHFSLIALLFVLPACEPSTPPTTHAAQPAPAEAASSPATPAATTARVTHWSEPPAQSIDLTKTYNATFTLKKGGSFTVALYAKEAPITVNSFVFLARQHYFDGVSFHRVIDGFMAQGGDPTGTGMGGPGYQFKNENSVLTFDRAGVLAMANAGPDTNGSQFFITFAPTPNLNGGYTIFGQVTQGMEAVNHITRRDPQAGAPVGDVIESIMIEEK